jgi:hypothetical protein
MFRPSLAIIIRNTQLFSLSYLTTTDPLFCVIGLICICFSKYCRRLSKCVCEVSKLGSNHLVLMLNLEMLKTKLHGLSPRENYTDRATAACGRSDCQLLWIEGATWSA